MTSLEDSTPLVEIQSDEAPNFAPFPIEQKEELKAAKKEEEMDDFVIPNVTQFPMKPKEEPVDQFHDITYNNQIFHESESILGEKNNNITSNKEEITGTKKSDDVMQLIIRVGTQKDNAITKSIAKPITKNIQKKRKSSNKRVSESESAEKKLKGINGNATDLECPECKFRTRSVVSWMMHLRNTHSTTPYLAGLALLCDCGNESVSEKHSRKCDIANFTVIRKSDGPIKRIGDEKMTPQCVLCEKYPKTMCGYAQHLPLHHNSNLNKNIIYLKCSCGFEILSWDGKKASEHGKKCDSTQFTLHKLEENYCRSVS